MQGGARHCGMRIAECGMRGPVCRRATAAAEAGEKYRAFFSSLPQQAVQESVFRRLLKKVQMQGGGRRAE
jgi:hypothetical protein